MAAAHPSEAMKAAKGTLSGYRPGVGIVLLNRDGLAFVGHRIPMPAGLAKWQMPQGGIDAGETPRRAALRELRGEIGTDHVDILAETSVMGAIPAEIFEGRNYGSIFGSVMLAAILGGAAGPWVTGVMYDRLGTYLPAFSLSIVLSLVSAIVIWLAAPRKVRSVAGRARVPATAP